MREDWNTESVECQFIEEIYENEKEEIELQVEEECNLRIDKYLSGVLPKFSRTYLQNLINKGFLLVNQNIIKASYKVSKGDRIKIILPPLEPVEIIPEDLPLPILYEDEDIILINKPKNMVVHPSPGHFRGTLVNGLMFYLKENLSGINGELRPGIVHRIDKDTTGVIVICKNDKAHRFIADQLKEHSITRKYIALVHGSFKEEEGSISTLIGRHPTDRKKMSTFVKFGKKAITHYKVLKQYRLKNGSSYSLLECELETGRTHQIRVHMSSIHHPIAGDCVYGNGNNPFHLEGQALHAAVLGFLHPRDNKYREWTADLPDYFKQLLKKLDTMCE